METDRPPHAHPSRIERVEIMAPRYEAALFPILVLLILVGLVVLGPR